MTTEAAVQAIDDPVFFPEDTQTYFGIVSRPVEGTANTTAVILLSGTHPGSTTMGRNRLWVQTARELAGHGYLTLRIDYAGLGESLPGEAVYDLDQPAVDELHDAIALLGSLGAERVVLVGTCFGSRTALAGAAAAAEGIDIPGILLLAPPARSPTKGQGGTDHLALYSSTGDLAKKALSTRTLRSLVSTKKARRRAARVFSRKVKQIFGRRARGGDAAKRSPTDAAEAFLASLRTVAQRGIPVHILFGTDDAYWTEFQRAQDGRLGKLLERAGDTIEIETVPGKIRGFTTIDIQNTVRERVVAWVQENGR